MITDVHGNRVTDRQVTLSATSGSLSPARAMPAPDGSVTAKWRLGSKRGVQVLTAEVRGTAVRAKPSYGAVGLAIATSCSIVLPKR